MYRIRILIMIQKIIEEELDSEKMNTLYKELEAIDERIGNIIKQDVHVLWEARLNSLEIRRTTVICAIEIIKAIKER